MLNLDEKYKCVYIPNLRNSDFRPHLDYFSFKKNTSFSVLTQRLLLRMSILQIKLENRLKKIKFWNLPLVGPFRWSLSWKP